MTFALMVDDTVLCTTNDASNARRIHHLLETLIPATGAQRRGSIYIRQLRT